MSALLIVPRWVIDGLEECAKTGDRDAAEATLLRLQRWQAHTTLNPALLGNLVDDMERIRAALGTAAALLRGEHALVQGTTGLLSVEAGKIGREASADSGLKRPISTSRD